MPVYRLLIQADILKCDRRMEKTDTLTDNMRVTIMSQPAYTVDTKMPYSTALTNIAHLKTLVRSYTLYQVHNSSLLKLFIMKADIRWVK